jgi:estrogen-related receptor beta like 1
MDDDGDEGQVRGGNKDAGASSGPAMGPIYLMWENSLEKLKILNYEKEYCRKFNKKACNRVHFVFPGTNASNQFDDFIGLCAWLFSIIGGGSGAVTTKGKSGRNASTSELFRPEEFDDPNTVVNKLLLALRQVDFRSSFPQQKLKAANGEPACTVLDFLTDKALSVVGFQWGVPSYSNNIDVEQAEPDDDQNDEDIAEDEELGGPDEELMFEDPNKFEISVDSSTHNILQALVDPIEWKTELERVGPKLRTNLQLSTNGETILLPLSAPPTYHPPLSLHPQSGARTWTRL